MTFCIDFNFKRFRAVLSALLLRHPLQPGQIFYSPGGTFKYRVIGACCRLYDRAQLPYPCCRLSWRGKEPFWNRQGKRFVSDKAAAHSPSYWVELVDYPEADPEVMTLYWMRLSPAQQNWWYSKRVKAINAVCPVTRSGEVTEQPEAVVMARYAG